jgi:glycerophosphoryl diester phosphodiesterase
MCRRAPGSVVAATLAAAIAGCGDNVETRCDPASVPGAAPAPFEQVKLVAHAFGSPDGLAQSEHYTESREGFETSYHNGFRAYEIDLVMLADGTVVALHDAHEEEYGLTIPFDQAERADLEGRKWKGKYDVLFGEDIIALMVAHPDVWMILDTKWSHAEIDQAMVALAPDDSVRDRLVPHVTSEEHANLLPSIYPFPELMLARYWWDGTDAEVEQRMVAHGIDNVMMWWNWRWNETLQAAMDAAGYHVWVHTPEEPELILDFLGKGVGVYSNGWFPCP